jgi:hypothetical protein
VGIGVFFTGPGMEYRGAGVLLLAAATGWWLYIQFAAVPRRDRIRAEQAASRKSRRPPRKADSTADTGAPTTTEHLLAEAVEEPA